MKSKITVTDIAALEEKYPQCVTTETKIIKKPVLENIRAALKLYGTVPGVSVAGDAQSAEPESSRVVVPAFMGKKA